MKIKSLDRMDALLNKLDGLLEGYVKPIPPKMFLEAIRVSLSDMRDEIEAIYLDEGGQMTDPKSNSQPQ